jgi:hypothetical protein
MQVTDEEVVFRILKDHTACEFAELQTRAFKLTSNVVTWKRVLAACRELESRGVVDTSERTIRSRKYPAKARNVRFVWIKDASYERRETIIFQKSRLLRLHYDYTTNIGDHATLLVKEVCEKLRYTRIKMKWKVGNHDIDVFAKHPRRRYWQAISVKNLRGPITEAEIKDILETTELARRKWKAKDIKPAIVSSYCYKDLMECANRTYGVNVAIMETQVAPLWRKKLYEGLNALLAYNFEITDEPTKLMTENIRQFICDQDYPVSIAEQPAEEVGYGE